MFDVVFRCLVGIFQYLTRRPHFCSSLFRHPRRKKRKFKEKKMNAQDKKSQTSRWSWWPSLRLNGNFFLLILLLLLFYGHPGTGAKYPRSVCVRRGDSGVVRTGGFACVGGWFGGCLEDQMSKQNSNWQRNERRSFFYLRVLH